MRVKFGNTTKDVPILEVNAANYIVPQGEEGTYHCRIEQQQFDPRSGKRLSRPRIQKFEAKSWPTIKRNLQQQGWEIDVLHDPTDWLRKQQEEREKSEAERVRAAREAEEKRKAEERKALKDEIIAELREAGMLKDAEPNGDGKAKSETKGGSKGK